MTSLKDMIENEEGLRYLRYALLTDRLEIKGIKDN
jgi:hypothetical protein